MLLTEESDVSTARRGALLRMAALCGLTLSGDVLAALAAGPGSVKGQTGFLAPDALKLTAVLAEMIIPATDTPGARAVGAHGVIDRLLGVCSPKQLQDQIVDGLARIDSAAMQAHGKRFVDLAPARQTSLLHALDEGRAPFDAGGRWFFMQLKSLTLFAYYTSEAGATRELRHVMVPGAFKGDVPFAKVGRRWAL